MKNNMDIRLKFCLWMFGSGAGIFSIIYIIILLTHHFNNL